MTRLHFHDVTPERIEKRLAEIAATERFVRRAYWRMIGLLVIWTAAGSVSIVLGLTSSDPLWGPILFWAGVGGADLAIAITLLRGWLDLEG